MPGDVRLPTLTEIEQLSRLPRWALAALSARCARRALPLFKHFWPQAPEEHIRTIEHAITLAEQASVPRGVVQDAFAACAIASGFAADVASAAAHAANASYCFYDDAIADFAEDEEGGGPPYAAIVARATGCSSSQNAISLAARAATSGDPGSGAIIRKLIRGDFDTILTLTRDQHWTDETPVSPEVFGPLWPDGPPSGWPPNHPGSRPEPDLQPLVVQAAPSQEGRQRPITLTAANAERVRERLHPVLRRANLECGRKPKPT